MDAHLRHARDILADLVWLAEAEEPPVRLVLSRSMLGEMRGLLDQLRVREIDEALLGHDS